MKKLLYFTSALITSALITSKVLADGLIVPVPPKGEIVPSLSIKYHHVNVKIDNQIARTEVDQVFVNNYYRDIEGTYIFPIPENATISKFSMFSGKEELKGEILDKEKARQIYEDIVRKLKDPAILEYAGRDAFKARIFPITAHGEKRIALYYSEILKMDSGLCTYRYTLNTEKFSRDPIDNVKIQIEIKSNIPIKTIYSPTHDVSVKKIDEHHAFVTYAEEGTKPDKDLLLYYTVSPEDIGLSLLTYKEEEGKGFFIAMVSPSVSVSEKATVARDVLFVLDTSGSMSGEKIEQAKDALLFCLNSLNTKDRFNVIEFDTDIKEFEENLVSASADNISLAKKFVKKLKADGGTNIDSALKTALKELKGSEKNRPSYLIFLTDGLPTVGETDISDIISNAKKLNKNTRIFSFGVGYDVNTTLLDRLSTENKGTSEYVRPEEDIEVKVSNFYSKISNPVLTDLNIDFSNISVSEIYPKELPDLFKGGEIIILGRYNEGGKGKLILTGSAEGKKKSFVYSGDFTNYNIKNDYIPRLWAGRKIGYLIEEIRSHPNSDNKELIDEIVLLSKKYGIMTEYTAFLVRDDVNIARTDEELFSHGRREMESRAPMVTGGSGVNQSINAKTMQKSAQVPQNVYYDAVGKKQTVVGVKQISQKSFYNKKGNWIDSDYEEKKQKIINVKRFSKAYFQLLEKDPSLGKYLSLGDNVLLTIHGNAVQIQEKGKEEFSSSELAGLFGK